MRRDTTKGMKGHLVVTIEERIMKKMTMQVEEGLSMIKAGTTTDKRNIEATRTAEIVKGTTAEAEYQSLSQGQSLDLDQRIESRVAEIMTMTQRAAGIKVILTNLQREAAHLIRRNTSRKGLSRGQCLISLDQDPFTEISIKTIRIKVSQ